MVVVVALVVAIMKFVVVLEVVHEIMAMVVVILQGFICPVF